MDLQTLIRFICIFAVTTQSSCESVTVNTRLGKITGVKEMTPDNSTSVYKFYNIPYAKPPVGLLRFAKPQPYGSWNGTLNATALGNACIQALNPFNVFKYPGLSEDCLQLNIYVPHNMSKTNKRSVMVWIHGGGYQFGSGTIYNGTMLAARGEVVVVTINYRIGIFGFLSYNDTSARGNFGLWDQIQALKWVKENIADYTGNPNSVTIFGQSAGGFSVSLLSLIPHNKGLFNRVIAESGVSDSFFAVTDDSKLVSVAIGDALGCVYNPITKNYDEVLTCLRSKSAYDVQTILTTIAKQLESSIRLAIPLAPVIDGELFNDYPSMLLSDKMSREFTYFRSLDMIVGNCNMEGSLFLLIQQKEEQKYDFNITEGIPTRFLCKDLAPSLSNLYFKRSHKISDAMCEEYTVNNNPDEQSRQVLQMYTDLFFIAPSVSTLEAHADNNKDTRTYQYIFTQTSPQPYGPPRPKWFKGSGHADEIVFLFGIEDLHYSGVNVTSDQYDLSLKMRDFWTNFAKTGNPNSHNSTEWPEFTTNTRNFIQLNDKNLTGSVNYDAERVKFWLVTIPNIQRNKVP